MVPRKVVLYGVLILLLPPASSCLLSHSVAKAHNIEHRVLFEKRVIVCARGLVRAKYDRKMASLIVVPCRRQRFSLVT